MPPTSARLLAVVALVAATVPLVAGCKLLKHKEPAVDDAGASAAATPPVETAVVDAAAAEVTDAAAAPSAKAAATAAKEAPNPFVAGQSWNGSYTCGQGSTDLRLDVTKGGNNVEAIFEFKTKTGKFGEFRAAGPFSAPTRHLHLTAGAWVKQPPGFVPVDLDGHVSTDGKTFSGNVQGPGCSTFSVHHG